VERRRGEEKLPTTEINDVSECSTMAQNGDRGPLCVNLDETSAAYGSEAFSSVIILK
jgi:hypothetical protein